MLRLNVKNVIRKNEFLFTKIDNLKIRLVNTIPIQNNTFNNLLLLIIIIYHAFFYNLY